MSEEIKKKQIEAWEICIKREFQDKGYSMTLGQMGGGCPNCGHLCSFNDEEFHCYKCDWDWKDEFIEEKSLPSQDKSNGDGK